MIKTLQRKFVFAAMTAVTILLLILLGAINIANVIISANQTEDLLNDIAESEKIPMNQPPSSANGMPGDNLFSPFHYGDRKMSSVFFVAKTGYSGEIIQIDTSRMAWITEETAESVVSQAVELKTDRGEVAGFQFKSTDDGLGNIYVFLDVSNQTYSSLRILFLSILAGIICWILMLVLIIFLSKKAIKPIAANIERQKQFVTDAGHEIKTPLAIILANTDALELHNGENKWSSNIREQTVRLNGLMQNLLTLSKIDESSINATKESFSLTSLAESISGMFQEMISQKGLILLKNYQPCVEVCANKELIGRLISILMDNAVKYSPAGGKITAELYKKEKSVFFVLANSCEKLPDCPPEKLFDRFFRGDAARTQKNGGYGIGLSAASSIVLAHGGTIRAKYEDNNTIVFSVELKN